MFSDQVSIAVKSLKSKPLRTFLTLIGIIIAVTTIVALLSLVQGLENSITQEFERLGSNKIYVSPKGFTGPNNPMTGLTTEDVRSVEGLSDFKFITPYYISSAEVTYKNEKLNMQLFGIPTKNAEERFKSFGTTYVEGRSLNNRDKLAVTIGYNIAKTKFSKEIRVSDRLTINGKNLVVIGIITQKGSDDDNVIYIPIDTLREVTGNQKDVTMIEFEVKDLNKMSPIKDKINKTLSKSRGNDNFEVITPDQIMAQIDTILSIIRIVLIGIASISLMVAGIGISNSMYTSVLERTNEIGVIKSIGARNKEVLFIFLIEAGLLGCIGGVIGVGFGYGIALLVGAMSSSSGTLTLLIQPNLGLFLFGFFFALITAIISGLLPAKHAANMKPVDALRGE